MNPDEYCKVFLDYVGINVEVQATKPPLYISTLKLSNQQEPVIIIYREEKPLVNTHLKQIALKSISGVEESLDDLSITGTPLECPFEDEESFNNTLTADDPDVMPKEHYHAPLSLSEARKCLSVVNLKMLPPLPVWILTDRTDRNNTFLLGSEIKDGWRKRIWAVAHSNQTEKIPIKDFLEDFDKLFKVNSGYKMSSEVCSVFNIKEDQRIMKNSHCHLEVLWKRPSYEVNLSQADTSLIIECSVGQEDSQISRWWQQLNLLHEYLELIKQRKQTQQVQVTYQRDSIKLPSFKSDDSPKQPLLVQVQDLLQHSDSMSVCRQLASEHNVTSALNSTIHELLDKQKGQDFTDKLWSLLIEAETYQELAECFQLVLREVRKQSVKPYIFTKNKTRLACLLRSLKSGSSDMELMLEPLELMVEMGLEKLKRDYMFMFLASQIANEEALCQPKLQSFSEVGGGAWQTTVDSWLRWLAQLHTVLELVSTVHTTLNTPTLVQVTSQALSIFVRPESPITSLLHLINNRLYNLRTPIVTKEVKSFIDGDKTFCKWLLKLSASADKHEVTSTYVLLEQSPFPQKILLDMIEAESANNTAVFSETAFQSSLNNSLSKIHHDKYSYIQLCSIADKLPH